MPFDDVVGVVPNELGRVEGHPGEYISLDFLIHVNFR